MVVTSRCFAFRALITQAQIWKRFWVEKLDKFTLFTHFLVGWNLKIFRNVLCQFFFRFCWHFKREKPVFWKGSFFAKQRLITRASLVYKTSRLVRIFLLINALNKGVLFFSRESYFIKAIENIFPVFAYPDINTRGVGRILDSYANPRRSRGFT